MTVDQLKTAFKIHTVVPSVKIHVMDEHYAVEMLNVTPGIIMQIVAVNLVLLVMQRLAVERSNVKVIRNVPMINCASRICAKLPVWWDDRVVKMHCVRLKITNKSVTVNRATLVILVYDVKL